MAECLSFALGATSSSGSTLGIGCISDSPFRIANLFEQLNERQHETLRAKSYSSTTTASAARKCYQWRRTMRRRGHGVWVADLLVVVVVELVNEPAIGGSA